MSVGTSLVEVLLRLTNSAEKEICGYRKKNVFLEGLRLECPITWYLLRGAESFLRS